MRSHLRSRSPEGSFPGMPLSCTRRPGACPTMRTRAVGEARSTGLGALGRWASQIRHARTSASRRSNWAGFTRMIKSVLFATRAPLMPPHLPPSPLNALSPLDGRYHKQLEPLRACFSEAALFRYRIAVEIRWLLALAAESAIAEIKPFSKATRSELERIIETFSEEDAAQVKAVEAETRHDVKAIEYWLKKRLAGNPEGARVAEFVHFACTSEDINNLAYGLMLKEGRDRVLLPALDRVIEALAALAVRLADAAMLARTHGQPASPTTLGKELANVVHRLPRAPTPCSSSSTAICGATSPWVISSRRPKRARSAPRPCLTRSIPSISRIPREISDSQTRCCGIFPRSCPCRAGSATFRIRRCCGTSASRSATACSPTSPASRA